MVIIESLFVVNCPEHHRDYLMWLELLRINENIYCCTDSKSSVPIHSREKAFNADQAEVNTKTKMKSSGWVNADCRYVRNLASLHRKWIDQTP